MQETCQNCRFAAPVDNRVVPQVECRRSAPIMVVKRSSCSTYWAPGWPSVPVAEWCGEYEAADHIGDVNEKVSDLERERDEARAFIAGDLQADLVQQAADVAESLPWKTRALSAERQLGEVRGVLEAMYDEYVKDEACDHTVINRLIERGHGLAPLCGVGGES